METLNFRIPIKKIQEKVMMHTSTLGRYRNNEAGVILTDVITLTPAERAQFSEYFEEALKETYEWIRAFGRGIDNAMNVECCDVVFTLERTWHYDTNMTFSVNKNLTDAIVFWIVYRWLENTKPDEAEKFLLKHEYAAQQAQLGLNSEIEILQRKYNIDH